MASTKERVVRRKLADGTIKEYRYERGRGAAEPEIKAGSVAALIQAYKRSPEWADLRHATHKNYGYYLSDLEAELGHVPAASVNRRTLLDMRDAIADTRG